MELSGSAGGAGNVRSIFSDFDIKNAAELEAHINMNAIAAKANFDKYYSERLTDVSKLWRDQKRRMDVKEPFETPTVVVDVGVAKFDYSSIGTTFAARLADREEALKKSKEEEVVEKGSIDRREPKQINLFVDHRVKQDDPLRLVIKGTDYTNVDKVCEALMGNTDVTHLEISGSGLEPDDCDAIATLISANKTIKVLDLNGNKIGSSGLSKLKGAFMKNQTIADLDLSGNGLGKSGAKLLAEILRSPLSCIQRLQVANNNFGIYGGEELAKGFAGSTTILSVGVQNNNLGNDGAELMLTKGFTDPDRNESITQLNLEANRIDDERLDKLLRVVFENEQLLQNKSLVGLEASTREMHLGDEAHQCSLVLLLMEKSVDELKLREKVEAEKKKMNDEKGSKIPIGKASAPAPAPTGGRKATPGKQVSKSPTRSSPAKPAMLSPAKKNVPAVASSSTVQKSTGTTTTTVSGKTRTPSPKKALQKPAPKSPTRKR